jgi:hypothetical protein
LGGGFEGFVEGVLPGQEAGEEAAQDLVELVLGQDLFSAGKVNNIAQADFIFCFNPTTTWLRLLNNITVPKYGTMRGSTFLGRLDCAVVSLLPALLKVFLPVFLVSKVATDGTKYLATALCSETSTQLTMKFIRLEFDLRGCRAWHSVKRGWRRHTVYNSNHFVGANSQPRIPRSLKTASKY